MSRLALTLDGIRVEVPEGSTILDAARAAGIAIPTLCNLQGYPHRSSCMVCVVEETPGGRLVPSCASLAREGLDVMTSTRRALSARAAAVELLLSEHSGDCRAPCSRACPAGLEVMEVVRLAEAGRLRDALLLTLDAIPFPGLMAVACAGYCERVCLRAGLDSPLGIRGIHELAAAALNDDERATLILDAGANAGVRGRMRIQGAGLAALAAAFHLRRTGFLVTIVGDPAAAARRGGAVGDAVLEALARETGILRAAGCSFEQGPGTAAAGEHLLDIPARPDEWRIPAREMARGRESAERMFVSEPRAVAAHPKPFHSIIRDIGVDELRALAREPGCSAAAGRFTDAGSSPDDGLARPKQPARCLACGCSAEKDCRLRALAQRTGARQERFAGSRLPVRRLRFSMGGGALVFEPGKCVRCGICVRLSRRTQFPLSFTGRGFLTEVGGLELYAAGVLGETGAGPVFQRIASECPTGSLAWDGECHA